VKKFAGERPHPAIITVYAALIAVAQMLPTIPMVGTGGSFSVADALMPLSGVFFGPVYGTLCAAIGGFVGSLIAPAAAWLGIFTFVVGAIQAFIAGCIFNGRWYVGAAVLLSGFAIRACFEVGRKTMIFAVTMFGSGLAATLVAAVVHRLKHRIPKVLVDAILIWCSCFAGLTGSGALYQVAHLVIFHLPVISWKLLAATAPVERVIFATGSLIVGTPLLRILPKLGIFVGNAEAEESETESAVEPN